MDEDNTTESQPVQTGADTAQPVTETVVEQPAADEVTTEPSEPSEDAETAPEQPSESEPDDRLKKFAASQGIELDSPSAIKAAGLALKAQSEATKNYQRASELEKATTDISDEDAAATAEATGQDPELIKRLQRVEVKEAVRDFWNRDGIDRSFEPTMVEILADKPYLAGDLDSLYAVAVMQTGGVAAVKSQAKRDTLEALAQKQQAAVPTGSAIQRNTPKEKPFAELSIPEMEKRLGMVRQ